ncbi:MAG: CHAD domain-containing protein [Gammaproteobacteria bacterium]
MRTAADIDLFHLSAVDGARRGCLAQIRNVSTSVKQLRDTDDPEALHNLRVALRRLRVILRAYGAWLNTGDKIPRSLGRLRRTTNGARNAEAASGWLRSPRPGLAPRERPGVEWLIGQWEQRQVRARRRAQKRVPAAWARIEERLLARLGSRGPAPWAVGFAQATGVQIHRYADALERALIELRSAPDDPQAHRVRLRAKSVRYLLEPFAGPLGGGAGVLAGLSAFQDQLGELQDSHVLAERLRAMTRKATGRHGLRVIESVLADAPLAQLRRTLRDDPLPGLMAMAQQSVVRHRTAWVVLHARSIDQDAALLESVRASARRLATCGTAPLRAVQTADLE